MTEPWETEDLGEESTEIRLVGAVTACRLCDWFWRPPPYGPYPSFDFSVDYPEVLRERTSRQHADGDFVRAIDGTSRAPAIVYPQILHGCRKAPLMTIGINPNLTAFWPGVNGSRWAYPRFSSLARYAYYYRHRTVHQESLPLEFIRRHLSPEGRLVAGKPGHVGGVRRSMVERTMSIELVYDDGSEEKVEQTWDEENHFVLLYDRSYRGETQFDQGDTIGGFLAIPDGEEVPVEQNVVGYYQRVIPILEQVSAYLRSQGMLPNLEAAEDICQLDMVACASPGWGAVFEIDKDEVVEKCVRVNAWVVEQLIQTRPKVIVFSGRSAFQMFNRIFKPFVTPKLFDEMDVFGLMKYTARDPHYLDIRSDAGGFDYRLRARIIISPHFSYDDNFLPHARMHADEWTAFQEEFAEAAEVLLAEEGRVSEPNRDDYRGIRLDNLGEFKIEYPEVLIELVRKKFDSSALIGEGIAQEILLGNVGLDGQSGHLVRSDGPCNFCVNDRWEFPEGCPYRKPEEPRIARGVLATVAHDVTNQLLELTRT